MEKVQLNFTKATARCVTSGTVFRRTTTELYDLYTHPEDISLFIEIVGDDKRDIPSVYIDGVTLKTLRYTLLQLNLAALNDCIVWLRAYNGRPLQEFASVCDKQWSDFKIYDCNFKLCDLSAWCSDEPESWSDTLVLHEDEVAEIIDNIINIINNNNN